MFVHIFIRHKSACERLIWNQTRVSNSSSSPWAALDLNALSPRRWAEGWAPPKAPLPQGHSAGCLPVCLLTTTTKKSMSRYFYSSALWSSHRLLKQSLLINIYSLSDGTGSMERGDRDGRVLLNNHHPSTSSPLSSLSISLKWKWCFREEFGVWARDGNFIR